MNFKKSEISKEELRKKIILDKLNDFDLEENSDNICRINLFSNGKKIKTIVDDKIWDTFVDWEDYLLSDLDVDEIKFNCISKANKKLINEKNKLKKIDFKKEIDKKIKEEIETNKEILNSIKHDCTIKIKDNGSIIEEKFNDKVISDEKFNEKIFDFLKSGEEGEFEIEEICKKPDNKILIKRRTFFKRDKDSFTSNEIETIKEKYN